MNYSLSEEVKVAISAINTQVSHSVKWGEFTQLVYPGECCWSVDGGPDWPIPTARNISITATRDGVVFEGEELLYEALSRIQEGEFNEEDALNQVLAVFKAAQASMS